MQRVPPAGAALQLNTRHCFLSRDKQEQPAGHSGIHLYPLVYIYLVQ